MFAGSSDGQACMWNFKGECMQLFAGHSDKVSCGALTLDGRQLVTGSADHTVRLFNPKTAETVHAFDKHKLLPECEVVPLPAPPPPSLEPSSAPQTRRGDVGHGQAVPGLARVELLRMIISFLTK